MNPTSITYCGGWQCRTVCSGCFGLLPVVVGKLDNGKQKLEIARGHRYRSITSCGLAYYLRINN